MKKIIAVNTFDEVPSGCEYLFSKQVREGYFKFTRMMHYFLMEIHNN
jgi:hypothetical protein